MCRKSYDFFKLLFFLQILEYCLIFCNLNNIVLECYIYMMLFCRLCQFLAIFRHSEHNCSFFYIFYFNWNILTSPIGCPQIKKFLGSFSTFNRQPWLGKDSFSTLDSFSKLSRFFEYSKS